MHQYLAARTTARTIFLRKIRISIFLGKIRALSTSRAVQYRYLSEITDARFKKKANLKVMIAKKVKVSRKQVRLI